MTYDLASTSSAESLTENPRVGGSIRPWAPVFDDRQGQGEIHLRPTV
jgi:hypothetical protein